jgi:arylsulfatase A-like enzyme
MAGWGTHVLLYVIARLPAALSGGPEECAHRAPAIAEEDGSPAGVSMLQHTGSLNLSPSSSQTSAGANLARTKPNIVLFLPDDMYLSEYYMSGGGEAISPTYSEELPFAMRPIPSKEMMPKLEAIVQSGATFSRAYSTSSTCTPSRYSLLTGRYPSRSQFGQGFTKAALSGAQLAFVGEGVTFFGEADQNENIAQTLRSVGYTTGVVGKWGMNSQADKADYDSPYADLTSLVQRSGFDFVDGLYIQNQNTCTAEICDYFSHNMEWQMESALRFMDGAMKQSQPFFLYFAATLPHHPPEASDALLGLFNSSQTPAGILPEPPDIFRYCSSCTLASHEAIWDASIVAPTENIRHELAALRWVDESLGVIYDFLSERGSLDNTYLVVSTDHGPVKGSLFELGTRVPLYVVGPGIAANTRVTDLVSHVDMAPTFMEWAGCGSGAADCSSIGLEELDGLSWASLVSGRATSLYREEIYFESMLDRAVVNKDHMKFILRQTGNIESFITASADEDVRSDLYTRIVDLSSLPGAYPAYNTSEQVYDLFADGLEQVNLVPDRSSSRVRLDGLHKYRNRIVAHDALTFPSSDEEAA